jgi:hypothetical protein
MKRYGSCERDCLVLKLLEGQTVGEDESNIRDTATADILSHVPRACEVLLANCALGGPHKTFGLIGDKVCSSVVATGVTGFVHQEEAAKEAGNLSEFYARTLGEAAA